MRPLPRMQGIIYKPHSRHKLASSSVPLPPGGGLYYCLAALTLASIVMQRTRCNKENNKDTHTHTRARAFAFSLVKLLERSKKLYSFQTTLNKKNKLGPVSQKMIKLRDGVVKGLEKKLHNEKFQGLYIYVKKSVIT